MVSSSNYGGCGHVWHQSIVGRMLLCTNALRIVEHLCWISVLVGDCKLCVLLVVRGIKFGCHVSDSRPGGLETII